MRNLPAEAAAELARLTADNLRLRRIEDAARALLAATNTEDTYDPAWRALRAALDLRPTHESDHKEPADELVRMLDNLDPELEHAWSVIARVYGNLLCHDWRTGETWQYMGTYHRAGAWSHHFRHRCLPATGKRTVSKVEASAGWTP